MHKLKLFLQGLSPVNDEAWADVENLFAKRILKKGEYFCDEGKVAREFAFLELGIVRGFYRSRQGGEYNKHFFMESSIIGGYTSLITGRPNMVIQEALTNCEIWVANYGDFVKLYNKHPDLERVGRLFAEHYFVEKETKEFEIVLYDAEIRYDIFKRKYPGLEQLVPQYHIASYLGISPTQLSRIRKKQVGVVSLHM